ncbi:MAG: aminoglycoside 3'-phosphotransferase [Clostridia bacterium]|nr:aminoglycoside 3'-phosphotransferase [Clostridia bacterium]
MKRTLIKTIPELYPTALEPILAGARIFDSSCSPEARVYFIDKDDGYYLKCAKAASLAREALMTEYFHKKGLGTEILLYESGKRDFLLSRAVRGEDLTHETYVSDPKRLADTTATLLRELHELDAHDCPVQDRMSEYLATAERNYVTDNYDKSHFPDSFGYKSASDAWRVLQDGRSALKCEVLLHGDYCLPNIMLDNWRFSAFIDVDGGGVGDRHVDLFWGAWTLWFNLGTDAYRDRFFDAYGRDKIDKDILSVIAAAEVFG